MDTITAYLTANHWVVWLVISVFFLILELATQALVSIWFVPSAIITALFSLSVDNVVIQTAIFVLLSALFLLASKLLYKKFFRQRLDLEQEEDMVVGRSGKAVMPITETDGKVLVGDIYWRAVSENEPIEPEETIKVTGIHGTTLIVTKQN